MLNNIQKQTAAMADRHMRRSAVSAGRVLFPIQKTTWKAGESELICLHGGLRFPYIGRMAKNFRLILGFFKNAFPFVPEKWSFRSLRPKNRKFLPI